jgi:hypothetical protein
MRFTSLDMHSRWHTSWWNFPSESKKVKQLSETISIWKATEQHIPSEYRLEMMQIITLLKGKFGGQKIIICNWQKFNCSKNKSRLPTIFHIIYENIYMFWKYFTLYWNFIMGSGSTGIWIYGLVLAREALYDLTQISRSTFCISILSRWVSCF